MKEYSFQFRGQTHHLKGLTTEVKERFLDYVIAKEFVRLRRQRDDGLIDQAMYAELKADVRATPWLSQSVLNELESEEGGKQFIRLMIVGGDQWDAAAINEVAALPEDSSFGLAMEAARDDAFPKAQTPPRSTATVGETSGGASFAGSHSA